MNPGKHDKTILPICMIAHFDKFVFWFSLVTSRQKSLISKRTQHLKPSVKNNGSYASKMYAITAAQVTATHLIADFNLMTPQ